MGGQAIQGVARGQYFKVDPDAVSIVGAKPYTDHPADTDDGTNHPLWDERCRGLKPEAIDPNMVKNVAVYGVRKPVLVRKAADGRLEVVDGRHRVVWTRLANKALAREGQPPLTLRVIVENLDDAEAAGLGIGLNRVTVRDSPMVVARNIIRARNRGVTDAQLAIDFAMTTQSVRNYVSLLETHPKVQAALDAGELSMSKAYELARVPRDEQPAVLERILGGQATAREVKEIVREHAAAKGSGGGGEGDGESEDEGGGGERKASARDASGAKRRATVAELRKINDYLAEDPKALNGIHVVDFLGWQLGNISYKQIKGLASVLRAAGVIAGDQRGEGAD